MKIEILGERKTGTNYARRMITKNFNAEIVSHGWKHRYPDNLKNHYYICCVRNPYQWLKSIYDKPYELERLRKYKFSDAIKQVVKDHDDRMYKNLMQMWNNKNRAYLNIKLSNRYILRHESVLNDWKTEFMQIKSKFQLTLNKELVNITAHCDDRGLGVQPFVEKAYFDIAPETLKYINLHLDKEIMRVLGYEFRH
jgi:hypothetical protein